MRRARSLAGRRIADLVHQGHTPTGLARAKGWTGELIEQLLGATAGSRPIPDFPELGVELKTLPITPQGKPHESTYVCRAPMGTDLAHAWEDSRVKHKLRRVLWVPLVAARGTPLGDRMVGTPLLWSPDDEEEATLRADWEALADLLGTGAFADIDARMGKALQLRPKAANAAQTVWALDDQAEWVKVNPFGFYLRARFTGGLVRRHYRLAT